MKNNLRLLFILLFVGVALPGGNLKRELEPYICFFDFASGSVGAWASYPPAQDTAYDPTIWVKSIGENKTRALVREITPNYEIGYTFGMRKKLNIYVDRNSLLSFRYYVKNHRTVEGIIVKFGFEDESSKEVTVPVNKKLSWEDAPVMFRDIFGDKEIKRLKAVAFMAVCPKADPEAMLRFAIDDVKIEGYREIEFRVKFGMFIFLKRGILFRMIRMRSPDPGLWKRCSIGLMHKEWPQLFSFCLFFSKTRATSEANCAKSGELSSEG